MSKTFLYDEARRLELAMVRHQAQPELFQTLRLAYLGVQHERRTGMRYQPRATFYAYQDMRSIGRGWVPWYNVFDPLDWTGKHESTVSTQTLVAVGLDVPPTPPCQEALKQEVA